MAENSEEVESATTQLEVGPPKFQATVSERIRKVFDINDLEDDERAILEAELTLKKVYTKD